MAAVTSIVVRAPVATAVGGREDIAVEGARGLAALVVVAAHYAHFFAPNLWQLKFATTGVDLFFVLSGFVFGPYLFGKSLPLLPHLIRRFFRLYPLYLLALSGYILLHEPAAQAWDHALSHLFMLHTSQSVEIAFFYNPAFWSLPPEVEFYLLLPLLAIWGRKGKFLMVLGGAMAIHLALVSAISSGGAITWHDIACVHLPGVLPEFLLGGVAWFLSRRDLSFRMRGVLLFTGLAWLCLVAWLFRIYVVDADPHGVPPWVKGNVGLGAAAGYMLLVAALSGMLSAVKGKTVSVLVMAGHLSYGVYLFHNLSPAILLKLIPDLGGPLMAMSALMLTLIIALLGHYGLERPLRNFGRRLSRSLQPVQS